MARDASSKCGVADDAWNGPSSGLESYQPGLLLPVVRKDPGGDVSGGRGVLLAVAEDFSRCIVMEMPPALILEIFTHLDARELCIVSCVCSLFRRLASDSHGWKDFYCERWGLPAPSRSEGVTESLTGKSWRDLYVDREWRSKALTGRFRMDMLHGHTSPVRCVRLLCPASLIVTAGYDAVVRIWNMEEGVPSACSRPLGETLRAIAVDMGLLVVAGSEGVIRVWHASPECRYLFDVAGEVDILLRGHTGPITCLAVDSINVYSGSWDMSVRVWERNSFQCVHIVRHADWVWSVVAKGRRIHSTAGSDAYTWDLETGELLRVRVGVHTGQVYAVAASQSGHFVFTGGEDGAVRMFDDRVSWRKNNKAETSSSPVGQGAVAAWIPHAGPVYSLAYEDPWLVSASGDGLLAMMNVRQVIKRATANVRAGQRILQTVVSKGETAHRMLSGFNQSAYSVDIGADRVVSGGEERTVRIWDFSQALEAGRRAQASRCSRMENRARRKNTRGKGQQKVMWAAATGNSVSSVSWRPDGVDVERKGREWVGLPFGQACSNCKGSVLGVAGPVGPSRQARGEGCVHQA